MELNEKAQKNVKDYNNRLFMDQMRAGDFSKERQKGLQSKFSLALTDESKLLAVFLEVDEANGKKLFDQWKVKTITTELY